MTTADLTCKGQTATPRRITRPALLAFALCLASVPAWAQTAPTAAPEAAAVTAGTPVDAAAAAQLDVVGVRPVGEDVDLRARVGADQRPRGAEACTCR